MAFLNQTVTACTCTDEEVLQLLHKRMLESGHKNWDFSTILEFPKICSDLIACFGRQTPSHQHAEAEYWFDRLVSAGYLKQFASGWYQILDSNVAR